MRDSINSFLPVDNESWTLLRAILVDYQLKKGDFLLQPGQVCRHLFFLQKGLLRSFYLQDGNERNVGFTLENEYVTDLKSLRTEQPSEVTIQALEPSTLYAIPKTDMLALYQRSHQLEAFGRQVLERLLEEQQTYASWFSRYTAKERYELLRLQRPDLLQRVSLGHVASFLGIQRETLSRLRKKK